MKKFFYLSILFLLTVSTSQAQITLVPNAAAVSGTTTVDNYTFGMCSTNYGTGTDTEELYTYTATADVPCASINLDPATQFTGVFVFESALPASSADVCLASAYENVFGNSNPVTANFAMTSGTTYYFVVTTDSEGDVSFTIDLDIPVIPTPYVVMSDASVTITDGTPLNFYDTGGPTCDYMLNEDYTLTVCPDATGVTADKIVQLEFTDFNRNNTCLTTSEITFYKGTTATVGQEIFPGEYSNVVYEEDVRIFTSFATGGCMTIVWENGGGICEGEGWEGNFQLIDNPCSTPISDMCSTAPLLMLGSTLETNTECFTGGSGACGIGSNNNGWFQFVADATTANIDYAVTGGNACYASESGQTSIDETSTFAGVQFLLYEGCGGAQQICTTVQLSTGGINVENGNMAFGSWTINSLNPGQTYYAQFDSYGSDLCNFTVTGGTGSALPLELSSFTAKENGKVNQLSWVTLSEENTDAHIIERAGADKNFQKIGNVDAAGFSVEKESYDFYDETPLPVSHYRIKTIDIDGSISISHIVTVSRKNKGLNLLSINPNPTKGLLTMDVDAETARTAELSMTSMTGKTIMVRNVELESGNQQIELNIHHLPQGVYIIQLSTATSSSSYKIIKN